MMSSFYIFFILGIDGRTTQRDRQILINSFNELPTVRVFLFSTKAGCMGTNIVSANRVVIFDASFNPCDDAQAIGRVYRYGQMKPVFVYRFVMDNSFERCIYDRQVHKQLSSNRLVDGKDADPYVSLADVSRYFRAEKTPIKYFADEIPKYNDRIIQNVLTTYPHLFTNAPILHQSLLLDRNVKLSRFETVLAKIEFTLIKAASNIRNEIQDTDVPQSEEFKEAIRKSGQLLMAHVSSHSNVTFIVYKILCRDL